MGRGALQATGHVVARIEGKYGEREERSFSVLSLKIYENVHYNILFPKSIQDSSLVMEKKEEGRKKENEVKTDNANE